MWAINQHALDRCFDVVESYQPVLRLVPQHQSHAAEAFEQGQSVDIAQARMLAQHATQLVIRDPATQMMHMVHADISREPAQEGG